MVKNEGSSFKALDARELVELLDAAGIHRAVVLSVAYLYGSASRHFDDEYERVVRENDWTAAQVALYPNRLIGFCGFNPLKPYALQELERCSAIPTLARGIKLHLGNSDVLVDNPEHVAQLRRVFKAANDHHMAIAVHMRASISRKRPYGAQQARIFVEEVLPAAPDVVVQIAHLAGSGPGYQDPAAENAMQFLAEAVRRGDPRMKNVWFDISGIVTSDMPPADAARLVQKIRDVGVDRVLYGSDSARGGNLAPREYWAAFRKLPLTDSEFARIARNVAPYLRSLDVKR